MIKSIKKIVVLLVLFVISITNAQVKKASEKILEKTKDSIIKTEVVNVVTSYVPKITDAFKIKQKPIIKHTKETQKKKLTYKIFSVPVASTFIPKSGVIKKIDLGKREEFYPNYFALGFGNKITPFFEAYIRKTDRYNNEFKTHLKFLLSADPVQETPLSSTYYTMNLNVSYAQQERYYSWKAGVIAERNKHNWYGLPENIPFNKATISRIEPEQAYNYFKVFSQINIDDSYLEEVKFAGSFFSDILSNREFLIDGNAKFKFPLYNLYRELNDFYVNTTFSYLGTTFEKSYELSPKELKHRFLTVGVHPTYSFLTHDILIKLGAKTYFSLDLEKSDNAFFIYPDVEISYPIVKDFMTVFIGASGDLETNSYRSLVAKNPHISPTQNLLQTDKKYTAFAGFTGKLKQQFSYNLKANYTTINNNLFLAVNQSKSNGTNNAGSNAFSFLGYEYGNSFKAEYDDVKILSFFGEIAFAGIKNLTIGLNGEFNQFTLTDQLHPWNTPEMKGEFFGTYNTNKWFAGANLFFVGERKGKQYSIIPEKTFTTINLDSYLDINLNGGYHFSDSFSAFLNLNNVLNNNYQQFNNFNVQGFQAMGGLNWKFDSLF